MARFSFHLFSLALILANTKHYVHGHGRLMEPASRASMWRYGWNNSKDYNDAQGYCGGFWNQWNVNGGKCGVCGDAYNEPDPKLHEVGGPYANGIIVGHYEMGSSIDVKVDITANHLGYFQFRLCPYGDPNVEVTQGCLDSHVLEIAEDHQDTDPTKYYISPQTGVYTLKVRLPKNLTCKQCLFQWTYTTGNSWGICEDGTGALGCGPQETFRACADIAIFLPQDFESPPCSPLNVDIPSLVVPNEVPGIDSNQLNQQLQGPAVGAGQHFPSTGEEENNLNSIVTVAENFQQQRPPVKPVAGFVQKKPAAVNVDVNNSNRPLPGMKCRDYLPVGPLRKSRGMSKWCRDNCQQGFCPSTHCACLMEPDNTIPLKFMKYLSLLRGC